MAAAFIQDVQSQGAGACIRQKYSKRQSLRLIILTAADCSGSIDSKISNNKKSYYLYCLLLGCAIGVKRNYKKGKFMLVTIKQKDFEALNDTSLIWTCIEPAIQQARGKNFAVKSEAYSHLTAGQRALFMFQVLYGHTANGIQEFYSNLQYLLSNKDVWSQLKKGMQYFADNDMMQIVEGMERVFEGIKTEESGVGAERHNILTAGIDKNAESHASISLLDKSFGDALPLTVKRVAAYIRDNADEFVKLID